jgi:O-antigen ligase
MRLDWTRWAFYLAVGPPFLLALFMIRSRALKAVLLLFMLVFVEAVLLTWRPIGYIAFSLTGAMAYVIFASLLTQPEARGRMLALNVPWLLFLSCALVALLIGSTSRVSDAATNWLYFQQFYLEGLIFFWIGRTAVRDEIECEKLLHWLIFFGAGAAILHFFSLATGYTFYASSVSDSSATDAWRYGGLFTNPNSLADFYAVVLPLALICRMGWSRPSRRTGMLILFSSAMMLGSLALTGSRGGTASAIAALSLAFLLLPISFRSAIGGILFAGLALGVGYLTVTNVVQGGLELTLERFQSRGVEDVRFLIWAKTMGLILDHPFGIGLDPYIFGDTLRSHFNTPHNLYLDIASQIGLVGLMAFLWLLVASMRRLWSARSGGNARAKTAATALFVGLAGFLLAGLTEPIYHNGLKFQRIICVLLGISSAAPIWAGLRRSVANVPWAEREDESAAFPSDAEPAFRGRHAS